MWCGASVFGIGITVQVSFTVQLLHYIIMCHWYLYHYYYYYFMTSMHVRYIAGVAAMTTVPPDLSVALHYFEQAKSMIDSFREFPDFEVGD